METDTNKDMPTCARCGQPLDPQRLDTYPGNATGGQYCSGDCYAKDHSGEQTVYDQMTATERAGALVYLVSELERYIRTTDDLDLERVVGSLAAIGYVAVVQRDWTASLELDHDIDVALAAHEAEKRRIDDGLAPRMVGIDAGETGDSVPAQFKLDE